MSHRAGMDGCGKSRPHRIRSPDRPARSESLSLPAELKNDWIVLHSAAYLHRVHSVHFAFTFTLPRTGSDSVGEEMSAVNA